MTEGSTRSGGGGGPIYGPWRNGNGELFQAAIGQFHTSLSDANPNDAPCGGLINGIEFMWGGRIRQVEAELGVTVNTQV